MLEIKIVRDRWASLALGAAVARSRAQKEKWTKKDRHMKVAKTNRSITTTDRSITTKKYQQPQHEAKLKSCKNILIPNKKDY